MSKKIGSHTSPKVKTRASRKQRFRKKLETIRNERPRLVVTRSTKHISVQVIDDLVGRTLVSASTMEADVRAVTGDKTEKAKKVFPDPNFDLAKDSNLSCAVQGLYSKCFADGIPCREKPE